MVNEVSPAFRGRMRGFSLAEVLVAVAIMAVIILALFGLVTAGVRQVWQVYSNVEQVWVFTSPTAVRVLTRADELTGDPVVPGFRMPVADLFPPSAPSP